MNLFLLFLWCQKPALAITLLQENFNINKERGGVGKNCRRHSLKSFSLHKYVFLAFTRFFPNDFAIFLPSIFHFFASIPVLVWSRGKIFWQTYMQHTPNNSKNKIINYFNFPFFSLSFPTELKHKKYVSTFWNWIVVCFFLRNDFLMM